MKPFAFLHTPLSSALTRQRLAPCLLLSSLALLAAPQARAVMMDIGSLPGVVGSIVAPSISADGRVVMGTVANGSNKHFFSWSNEKGFTRLGDFSINYAQLNATNRDGTYSVGYLPVTGNTHAFIWSAGNGFIDLGTLGGAHSNASGVSDDGSVVVGRAQTASGNSNAFRWTSSGMQDLGALGQYGSIANGVSGDGAVVVGQSGLQAFRWTATTGMTDLGHLPGYQVSIANATNRDGSVVVGYTDIGAPAHAFRWTTTDGMKDLGTLGGSASYANDVNADGSVIVGGSNQTDGTFTAYRWTQATGMLSLGVLSGESRSEATGVSDDGNTIVGTSGTRAFIWTPDAPAIQDLENLQRSQLTSANTLGHLTASQNRRMRDLNQQQCLPGGAQVYCLSAGLSAYSGEGEGSGKQQIGQVTGGLRINEQFAVGASANLGQANLHTEAAKQTNAYGLALWGTYQQQLDELGWTANASLAMGQSHNSFERGVGLADVQRARATTNMNSTGVRLAAGYGLKVRDSLVTPEIALSHRRTDSDGFTERNVAMPLTMQSTGSQETYATLGVRSATPLSPNATLQLGLAVDALLDDNTDPLKGHSNVPGLSQFELRSNLDKRSLVPMAMMGVSYALSPNATLAGQVQAGASTYQQQDAVYGVGVQYRYAF